MDRDPWQQLSLYQSRDLLARRYRERHGRALGDAECLGIAAHLIQGQQYFASARGAGDLVRPLLLYYGAVALARGLVLFLRPGAREGTISQGHGVRASGWTAALGGDRGGPRQVPDLSLGPEAGTFSELAAATANDEPTRVDVQGAVASPGQGGEEPSYPPRWIAKGTSAYPSGAVLTVREVLGRLPDLAPVYEEALGEPAACVRADLDTWMPGLVAGPRGRKPSYTSITLYRTRFDLPPLDALAATLGLPHDRLQEWGSNDGDARRVKLAHASFGDLASVLPPVRTDLRGSGFLVAPTAGGLVLSTLSLLHLVAFAVATLVRYHPSAWQSMVALRPGDQAFPLLKAAVALVESRFPAEVADRLQRATRVDEMIEQPHLSRAPHSAVSQGG